MSGAHGVTAQLARFSGALRGCGVRLSLGDEIDGAAALALVDLLDRREVHRALRIALKVPREAWPAYDRLFAEYWGGPVPAACTDAPRPPRDHRGPPAWRWDGQRVRLDLAVPEQEPEGDVPGYSPEPVLRRKPFDQLAGSEIAEMERLLARLAQRLATRRSRRRVATRGRGEPDLRRSLRRALATQGELLDFAHRARPIEEPSVVILHDTSGSMDSYARFFLALAFALRRVMRRVEIFAFNTSLIRVTRMINPADVVQSQRRLADGVADWSGGTRIGACLAAFAAEHGDAMVDRNTTLILLSDGLDHGDTDVLARAMRGLHGRARSIVWLNPLLGDPRYRPEAAGMRAALPFVDHFGSAHDLASLEQLLRFVGRGGVTHFKGGATDDSRSIRLSPS